MPISATPITSLFVYGTLLSASKKPMARQLRRHSQLRGTGFFPGQLFDLGAYPGAIYNPKAAGFVHGELYTFSVADSPGLLQALDAYEGDAYVRAVVPVQTEDGLVNCWTYLFTQPTHSFPLIASGRYFG